MSILSSTLSAHGVVHSVNADSVVLTESPVAIRARQIIAAPLTTVVAFDAILTDEREDVAPRLRTKLIEGDHPAEVAVEAACHNWVTGCLDPIRRSVDIEAEPDTTFHHFVDSDRQQVFDVFLGDYLVTGEGSRDWGSTFVHSLYDWMCARCRFEVPDRAFNLAFFQRSRDGAGEDQCSCLMNGEPWREADEQLALLDWPAEGFQLLRNFAVLKRLPMGRE